MSSDDVFDSRLPPLCAEVADNMADVLEGAGSPRLLDHLADCDRCRDARHDAERLRALVEHAGADFVPPVDLEARMRAAVAERRPAQAATGNQPVRPARWRRVWATVGVPVAVAAAIAIAWRATRTPNAADGDAWHGQVARVSRAGGGDGGLIRCDAAGRSCAPLGKGAALAPRSRLRTDEQTRAFLALADGTQLALDRSTEIVFAGGRTAELVRGAIAADVAHLPSGIARFGLPQGRAEVLGTKFALRADDAWTSVDVSRGAVRLLDGRARSVTVRAGEEGRIFADLPPDVGAAPSLGETLVWGEAGGEPGEATSARGLGELRAKKPGTDRELDRAVRLTTHTVKVRIAGAIARTEIEEVFSNQTGDVLEGIYRFPLPPDAKIERLALEVDGRMEEGAFVDRDRAAAIWRGAIAHAAPRAPKPKQEIVWVPGPWRDPALLEWQRGGRFELRIFPIPRHGSRRIVLAYTQTLSPAGGMRRYAYPLAHDPGGSTRVDRFDIDVQVRGHDPKLGVRAYGYPLRADKQTDDGAATLAWSARGFVPSGDLQIVFPPADRDAELSAWSYRASDADASQAQQARQARQARQAQQSDDSYVAIALRPRLPRVEDDVRRDFVLVVDTSRSMFGETYQRAVRLVTRFLAELDPADRVALLACDTQCRAAPGGLAPAGQQAASRLGAFLAGITPDGASDVAGAVAAAAALAGNSGAALRVIYFGDGAATMGPVRPASVTGAVERALPAGRGTVTAVAIGAESDLQMLGALARGGGGVVVPHVPGQTTAEAAYAVLGSTYGSALREVTLTLPEQLHEVAPRKLDTIPAGGEAFVVARLTGGEAAGTIVLRGKLGARDFEQRYPVRITASAAKGNAFVPRLYAAVRIADLEADGSPDAKRQALALSGRFNVASRYSSLLVLESPAMFRAFGLDNARTTPEWTGEEAAEGTTADGEIAAARGERVGGLAVPATAAVTGGKYKRSEMLDDLMSGMSSGKPAKRDIPDMEDLLGAPRDLPRKQAAAAASEGKAGKRTRQMADDMGRFEEQERAPRRMIPMRRIWERVGAVVTDRLEPRAAGRTAVANLEARLADDENRRDLVKRLYVLHMLADDVAQAADAAERWTRKAPLDPEALLARADVAARQGDRDAAIRMLGSVVEVRPDDFKAQGRMARLWRLAGRHELACRPLQAVAELHPGDAARVADAVRCARRSGQHELADELLAVAEPKSTAALQALLDRPEPDEDGLRGDLRVEATWSGDDADLDLALVDPRGQRVSWFGGPTRATLSARDVVSVGREALALRGARAGDYAIEISRATGDGDDSDGAIRGDVTITVAGARQRIPFTLRGQHARLALARIKLEPRLVPLTGVPGRPPR